MAKEVPGPSERHRKKATLRYLTILKWCVACLLVNVSEVHADAGQATFPEPTVVVVCGSSVPDPSRLDQISLVGPVPSRQPGRADGTARLENGGGLHMRLGHLASTTRRTWKQPTPALRHFSPREKTNVMQLLEFRQLRSLENRVPVRVTLLDTLTTSNDSS